MAQRRLRWTPTAGLIAGFASCLAVGAFAASGRGTLALVVVGFAIVAGATILNTARASRLLWMGVAFTAPLQGVRIAPLLALSDVLLIATFATLLPTVLRARPRVLPVGLITTFGVLITAGLVGTFFAPDVAASLTNLVKIVLAAGASVLAMTLWEPGLTRLRQFAWLWFAGATASATWAIVTPRPVLGRALGLTTHPNHFGLVCALAVGLGLGLAMSSTGRGRTATVIGIVLLTVGVGLSGSRSAVLSLAIILAVTAVLTRRLRLLVATGVAVVLAAMAVIAGIVQIPASNALSRLGGGGGSAASDLERNRVLTEAFASIARHPFTGDGFEFAQVAHNIYVQALVVGGPVALLSFLYLGGLIVRSGLRATRAAQRQREGPVLAGLTAGYVGYLFSGAFVNILWDRYLWTYIGLLLVIGGSVRQSAGSSGELGLPVRVRESPSPQSEPATEATCRAGTPAITE